MPHRSDTDQHDTIASGDPADVWAEADLDAPLAADDGFTASPAADDDFAPAVGGGSGSVGRGGSAGSGDDALPQRPRRKLVSRVTIGLAAVVLVALGFSGGVLVQKGRGSTVTAAGPGAGGGFAARGAQGAAAGGQGARGAAETGGAASAGAGTGAAATGAGTAAAGATTSTSGEVTNVKGSTLYVTTTDGSLVRVVAASGASVQRTSKASMTGIHPGDTVTVSGTAKSDGTVSATSVSATADGVTAVTGGPGGFPGGGFPGGGAAPTAGQ